MVKLGSKKHTYLIVTQRCRNKLLLGDVYIVHLLPNVQEIGKLGVSESGILIECKQVTIWFKVTFLL